MGKKKEKKARATNRELTALCGAEPPLYQAVRQVKPDPLAMLQSMKPKYEASETWMRSDRMRMVVEPRAVHREPEFWEHLNKFAKFLELCPVNAVTIGPNNDLDVVFSIPLDDDEEVANLAAWDMRTVTQEWMLKVMAMTAEAGEYGCVLYTHRNLFTGVFPCSLPEVIGTTKVLLKFSYNCGVPA